MLIKKKVTATIAVHEVQADLITSLQKGKIDFSAHSLREIADIIGQPEAGPQKIKGHLQALVKLGVLSVVNGQYHFEK